MTVELAAARQRVDDERSHARDPALPTDAPATDRLTELRNRETLRAETWDAAPTRGLRGLIRGPGVKGIVVVSGPRGGFTSGCCGRTVRPAAPVTAPAVEHQEERDPDQREQEQSVGQHADQEDQRQHGQHREEPSPCGTTS